MATVTVFGAGAMGTAMAMHLARCGNETRLWASQFDPDGSGRISEDRGEVPASNLVVVKTDKGYNFELLIP